MAVKRSKTWTGLTLALAGMLATGCASKRNDQTSVPTQPAYADPAYAQQAYAQQYQAGDLPRQDAGYDDIYVQGQTYAQPTQEMPELVGYDAMSNGEQVAVVYYVHTYPEAIETFPRVYWAGRWYYNVQGSFVFWDPYYGSWCYYWGPPAPLVVAWNYHYPWVTYSWGVGYYGAGWYWGGVGVYGYHSYGRPSHHWHDHYGRPSRSPNADPGGPTGGGPSVPPNNGGGSGNTPGVDQVPTTPVTPAPRSNPTPTAGSGTGVEGSRRSTENRLSVGELVAPKHWTTTSPR